MDNLECLPTSEDGIRRLALVAAMSEMYDARAFLDVLEIRMLKALRIKPDGVGRDDEDEVEPVEIEHVRKRGLRVRWRWQHMTKCEDCWGRGTLHATGASGRSFYVTCPECDGWGKVEGDQEDILTDIDGNKWRKAA